MFTSAIVLAAGIGSRFKSATSKALAKIAKTPIITFSLRSLNNHPLINDIIVVCNSSNRPAILEEISRLSLDKVTKVILGGKLRQDSVRCGLKALDSNTDIVLIHDGVRPFIDASHVSDLIKKASMSGAAISAVSVKATIKLSDNKLIVRKTLDREKLWEVHTPQVFKKELILKAYSKFGKEQVTDDSSLIEKLGVKVSIVCGSYSNIKITTPEDIAIAQAILSSLN